MTLQYVSHTKSSKYIHLKAKAITQKVVYEINLVTKLFGHTNNELTECLNGLQSEIDQQPRINAGFLNSYIKLVMEKESLKVYHENNTGKKLLCEIVRKEETNEKK